MPVFRDRYFTSISNSPGTAGDFVVSTALPSFRTFQASDDALLFDVVIEEGLTWEVRTDCTYTHGTTTLSRGTLSSSSSGVAINFTSAATLFVTLAANRIAVDSTLVHIAGTETITGDKTFSGTLDAVTPTAATNDTTVPTTEWVNDKLVNTNWFINGGFDFWQRGTSLGAATGNRYLADRWLSAANGSTCAPSQQTFTLGQTDVPNNPKYYHRVVVASVAGAGNFSVFIQRIEDVRLLSNKTVTLSFWAKADAAKNIALELYQAFGSGGSPSAPVEAIGVTTYALTTTWTKFTTTVTLPSISGKTLGTDANTSGLFVNFWLESGSTFNARNNSLGQQSGTFDFAMMKLEEGSIATAYPPLNYEEELSKCQRYYQVYPIAITVTRSTAGAQFYPILFPVRMRVTPTVTYSGFIDNDISGATNMSFFVLTPAGANGMTVTGATIAGSRLLINAAMDSEL